MHLGKAAALTHDWLRVQQTVRALNNVRPEHRRPRHAEEAAELAQLVDDHRRTT